MCKQLYAIDNKQRVITEVCSRKITKELWELNVYFSTIFYFFTNLEKSWLNTIKYFPKVKMYKVFVVDRWDNPLQFLRSEQNYLTR